MKIGKSTLHWPWYNESMQALDFGTAKGVFSAGAGTSWKPESIEDCFAAYKFSDLIRAPIDDLVESACGLGHYNTVEKVTKVFEKSKPRDLADSFGEKFNLDGFLPNVLRLAIIAGYCPVETRIVQDIEKCALKIVHPLTVKDIKTDPATGDVLSIKQVVDNKEATINGANLAWFTYGKMGNDPRGVSLVRGILPLLNSLNKANDNVSLILERYIAPIGIWKTRQAAEVLKAAVLNRGAGEDIFLGRQTSEEMTAKNVEFISIDPRVPFWEYIQDMKSQIFAYMRASNLWYERDATLASDTALEQIIGRHVSSIQRELKRAVERYWYKPLILANFDSETEVPRINFGKEPTGVGDIEPAVIITKGLDLGFIRQKRFDAIMQQIGVKLPDEEEEEAVEEADAQTQQDQQDANAENQQDQDQQQDGQNQNQPTQDQTGKMDNVKQKPK
jgi:hypothetical protein